MERLRRRAFPYTVPNKSIPGGFHVGGSFVGGGGFCIRVLPTRHFIISEVAPSLLPRGTIRALARSCQTSVRLGPSHRGPAPYRHRPLRPGPQSTARTQTCNRA